MKADNYTFDQKKSFLFEAFSRNIGLLNPAEQLEISSKRIAIPGLGGVGGIHLINFVRTGFSKFNISDFDVFELANFNRQVGAKISTLLKNKLKVMSGEALDINPHAEIKEFMLGISEDNIDEFLEDVDLVIDSLDFFCFEARRLLFLKAREKDIPVITAGPIGFGTCMMVFGGKKHMSFDEYFCVNDDTSIEEGTFLFQIGMVPDLKTYSYFDLSRISHSKGGKAPSLGLSCQLASAAVCVEAIKIICKKDKVNYAPYHTQIDLFLNKYKVRNIYKGNKNPFQKLNHFIIKKALNKNEMNIPDKKLDKNEDKLELIVKAGTMAPSGDNAQPWKFSIIENKVSLYLDEDSDRSFFNLNQIASLISCGAVCENIRQASLALDLNPEIKLTNEPNFEKPVVEITLKNEKTNYHDDWDAIWRRSTNRKMYEKRPLLSTSINELEDTIREDINGVKLNLIHDERKIKEISGLVYNSDLLRSEIQEIHEHLFSMLRFNNKETENTKDGLPLKNLEVGISGETFLRMTKSWKTMNFLNKLGFSHIAANIAASGVCNSSAIGMISIPSYSEENYLKGGIAFQRIWLKATSLGLNMQPLAALPLFYLRNKIKGIDTFPENRKVLLLKTFEKFGEIYPISDSNLPLMMFRIGYSKPIKVRTLRRDPEYV